MSAKEGPEEVAVPVVCRECGTECTADAAFCTNCGVELAAQRVGGRRRPQGDAAQRSRTRQEFGRIKQVVLTVRSVFTAGVVYAVVMLLLQAAAAAAGHHDAWLWWLVGGNLLLTAAGALWVLRAPLIWTTVGASYWTLNVALMFWWEDFALPPGLLVQGFLMLAFWFAVGQAARVERLMAADPTLQIVRRRISPERRAVGGVADGARQHARQDRRRQLRARLRLLAIVVVALLGLGYGIRWLDAPPPVATTIDQFVACWGRHDLDGVAALFDGGANSSAARDLRDAVEQRGWQGALPGLGDPTQQSVADVVVATWSVPDGKVDARLSLVGRGWCVTRVLLPPLQVSDVGPAIAGFRAAWGAPGTAALVALFRSGSRDRLGPATERMLERRQWQEQRPTLGDVDPGSPRGGRFKVLFALGNDELGVTFEYWHPQWWVTGISLPRP